MTQPIDYIVTPQRTGLRGRPTYTAMGDSIYANGSLNPTVTGITASGTTATTASTAHGFQVGQSFRMANAAQAQYNGFFTVATVPDANSFTYTMKSAPSVTTATTASAFVCVNQSRYSDRFIPELFNQLSGLKMSLQGNCAVGGDKASDTVARLAENLAFYTPDYAFVCVGTNDIANDIAAATTKANLITIANTLIAFGVVPIMTTIPPVGTGASWYSTTRRQNLWNLNDWIIDYFGANPKVVLIDLFAYMVGPTDANGAYNTSYAESDGVHPSKTGAFAAAGKINTQLASFMPKPKRAKFLANNYAGSSSSYELCDVAILNTATGGTVTGTGASGTAASGLTVTAAGGGSQTVVASVVARADGIGNNQRMVLTGVASLDRAELTLTTSINGRVSAGDKIVLEANISGASVGSGFRYVQFGIEHTAGGLSGNTLALSSSGTGFWGEDFDMWVETPEFVVPAGGVTTLRFKIVFAFQAAGSGTFEVGRISLRKKQT